MKKQDVLSILFTFVVGFIGGGYLYVAHFSKLVPTDSVPTAAQVEAFTVVGEAYGGCGGDCPSFQVLGDGSYRYQYAETTGAPKSIKSGTLPLSLQKSLKTALDTETLIAQSQPTTPTDCASRTGAGTDVRYKITYDAAEYTVDSCGTAYDGQSDTWKSLANLWNYFQTPQE